jgi:hypothetical protein
MNLLKIIAHFWPIKIVFESFQSFDIFLENADFYEKNLVK